LTLTDLVLKSLDGDARGGGEDTGDGGQPPGIPDGPGGEDAPGEVPPEVPGEVPPEVPPEAPPEVPPGEQPTTLQTGGHTITNRTREALGLSREEAKQAMEGLKEDILQGAAHHQHKILSNGDVVDSNTGELLGNLFDYL